MRLTAPQPLQDALQDPVTPDSTSSAAGPHTYRSPAGGRAEKKLDGGLRSGTPPRQGRPNLRARPGRLFL